MRIRMQSLVAIVVVFIGTAVAAGMLTYSKQREKAIGRLRVEARSVATALAEVAGGSELGRSASAAQRGHGFDSLRTHFGRTVANGQASQIFVLTRVGSSIWAISEGEPESQVDRAAKGPFVPIELGLRPTADEMDQLVLEGTAVVRNVVRRPGEVGVMSAFAPVVGADGEMTAILGVVVDAEPLGQLARELPLSMGRLILIWSLIGTLATLLISSIFSRWLTPLVRWAVEGASGDVDRRVATIQELNELSNTFCARSGVVKGS